MTQFVARYRVTAVRREPASDGSHTHVTGVLADGTYFALPHVLRSIDLHDQWYVDVAGEPSVLASPARCLRCGQGGVLMADAVDASAGVLRTLPDC